MRSKLSLIYDYDTVTIAFPVREGNVVRMQNKYNSKELHVFIDGTTEVRLNEVELKKYIEKYERAKQ